MGFKEFKYKCLKRRLRNDRKLLGYIGNRIKMNKKKVTEMENSDTMLLVN